MVSRRSGRPLVLGSVSFGRQFTSHTPVPVYRIFVSPLWGSREEVYVISSQRVGKKVYVEFLGKNWIKGTDGDRYVKIISDTDKYITGNRVWWHYTFEIRVNDLVKSGYTFVIVGLLLRQDLRLLDLSPFQSRRWDTYPTGIFREPTDYDLCLLFYPFPRGRRVERTSEWSVYLEETLFYRGKPFRLWT